MAGFGMPGHLDMSLDDELHRARRLITDIDDTENQTFADTMEEDNTAEPTLWAEGEFETPKVVVSEPAENLEEAKQHLVADEDEVRASDKSKAETATTDFDADEEDADELDHGGYGTFGYNNGYTGSSMGSSSTRVGGRADTLLDFIDEVSDGINSYLGFLEERHKGVVYDRHERAECARWRELLRTMHTAANKAASAVPKDEANKEASQQEASYAQRPMEDWSAELRPCRPPQDVQFEAPPPVPGDNGRRRLAFSACFESGNLALAKSDSPTSYTLFLDFDVNTSGYTQWFYFGVRGGHQGLRVTFRIVNMSKAESLFCTDRGMRPVVWSEKADRGWERGCTDVSYYPNEHRRDTKLATGEHSSVYYTLEFTYTFEFDEDTVFFAYHYPYTYTHLQDFIAWLLAHPYISRFLRKGILCRTIGGLVCDILEIGEDEPSKPLAVVTARVHPGESNSSWMVQGLLQFLCSPASEAQALRDACTWLVVPMLNPDGVVQGNYRCGLAGADLNRAFQNPHRRLHPTVWHLKERLRGRRIDVYLDLHGHSKREGIFLYGGTHPDEDRSAQVKLLPKLCSIASTDFKYYQCVFSIQDAKLTTARLVAFLQFGILHAYTVEASFSAAGTIREEEEGNSNAGRPPLLPTGGFATQTEARAKLARAPIQARPPGLVRRSNSIESLTPSEEGSEDEGFRHYYSEQTAGERQSFGSATFEDESPTAQHAPPAADLAIETFERLKAMRPSLPGEVRGRLSATETAPSPIPFKENFDPSRLEMAGPTLLKSLFSCWQLTKGLSKVRNGYEEEEEKEYLKWRHLHYDRLTVQTAKEEYQKLLEKRKGDSNDRYAQAAAKMGYLGEDPGSDSQPSEDEKSAAELHAIHRRILAKLRRRHESDEKPKNKDDEPQYKTVIAFGKSLRLPIVHGRLAVPDIAKAGAGAGRRFSPSPSPDGDTPGTRPRSAPSGPSRVAVVVQSIMDAPKRNNAAAEGAETSRPAPRGESLLQPRHRSASCDNDGARGSPPLSRRGSKMGVAEIGEIAGKPDENPERDRVDAFLAKMCSRHTPSVQLEKKEGSVVRHRSDDGCYGPSDVRSFVEVRSIKPQNSASRRAAAQLRKPLTGPANTWRDWAQQRPAATPPTPAVAFSLPPASAAHPGQKRSGAQALHRVVIEKDKSTATATSQSTAQVPAVSGSAAPVASSDGRRTSSREHQWHVGGGRPCSPDHPDSSSHSRRKPNHAAVANAQLPSEPTQQGALSPAPPAALDASSSEVPPPPAVHVGHAARDRGNARRRSTASGGSASDGDPLDVGRQRSYASAPPNPTAMVGLADDAAAGGTALDEETASASTQFERQASGGNRSSRRSSRASREELESSSLGEVKRQISEMVLAPDDSFGSLAEGAEDGPSKVYEADLSSPQAEQTPRRPLSANLTQAGWRPLLRRQAMDGWTDDGADTAAPSAQDALDAAEASIPLSSMLASSGLRPKPSLWMEPPRSLTPTLALPRTLVGTGNTTALANAVVSTATKAAGAARPMTPSASAGRPMTPLASASTGPSSGLPVGGLFLQPQAASQAAITGSGPAGGLSAHAMANAFKDASTRRSPGLVGSGAGVMQGQGLSTNVPSGTKQLLPPRSAGPQANARSGRAAHRSGATSARGASAGVGAGKHTPRAPVYQHLIA